MATLGEGLTTAASGEAPEPWDAVILAGGAGTRLGGVTKGDLTLAGATLMDRALSATVEARARVIVGGAHTDAVTWTTEDPPGTGPAAGIAAGLRALAQPRAPWVVVLAVDTPGAAGLVPRLLASASTARDGAWIVDAGGRAQPLLAVYRTATLAVRCRAGLAGASVARLVGGLDMTGIHDELDAAHDVDTWADVALWEERLR